MRLVPIFCAALLLLALAGCAAVPVPAPMSAPPSSGVLTVLRAPRPVIGLALGGGAARGFAHVGVIQTLEQHGIVADVVVGTSVGSFVGALYAGGIQGIALLRAALELEQTQLSDFGLPSRGFLRGERVRDYINNALGQRRIEALGKPFAAVATELRTGELVAFTRGEAGMAVRASSSIPGVFQPVAIGGREYVDGGLVSPVPVATARAMGADVVIAVDVSRKPEDIEALDSTVAVLRQAVTIMGQAIAAVEVQSADVLIRPDIGDIGLADFARRVQAIERGVLAARAALPAIRAAIEQKARDKAERAGSLPR